MWREQHIHGTRWEGENVFIVSCVKKCGWLLTQLVVVFCSYKCHLTPESVLVIFFMHAQDFSSYLAFSGIVLHNAQLYETSQLENRRNRVFLFLLFKTPDILAEMFFKRQFLEHVVICFHMSNPHCGLGAVRFGQPYFRRATVFGSPTEEDCSHHLVFHAGSGMHYIHFWCWNIGKCKNVYFV